MLSTVSLLALLLALAPQSDPAAEVPGGPNVVIVFVDDVGWADLGCTGAEGFATPHLDRLAEGGTRFTQFYVSQPVCGASRASLLTGCYANRVGLHGAPGPDARHGINPEETTLAELCKSRGYATAIFGKWHLGHHPEFLPLRHGFDEYYGIPYSNDMWPYHPENPKPWGPLPLIEGEEILEYNPDQTRFTRELTERGVAFIEHCAQDETPFFLYVPHPMAHVPLFASDAFAGSSERGLYGDVMQELDWSVGRLVDALERTGQRENTLFLFSSDNGPWLSYGDHSGSAGPLREGKGTTFEGGVRVPCIVSWPGRIPAGRVSDEPWMTIDVLPTVAGLIGAERPELPIDGLDAWPLLAGEEGATAPHEALFFWYHSGDLEAVRSGRFKLHFPHGYRSMVGRESGRGGFPGKYDHSVRTGLALFDLEADPGESTDVSAEHSGEVARLSALADGMRARLGDRLTKRKGSAVRAPGRLADLRPPELRHAAVPGKAGGLRAELARIAGLSDPEVRAGQLDGLWDVLVAAQRVPFVAGDEALFLWRGEAESVTVAGDHTGWDPRGSALERIEPLDVWLRSEELPSDARVDYKLVVDGEWLLDPANQRRQRGGFGDNSELQMPGYAPSPWVLRFRNVPEGRWLVEGEVGAGTLGAIRYRVWAPPGIEEGGAYPTLYVLDGHEYADPELGALPEVLDNLVAAGRIEPILAVFVDPRVGGENRRGQHYLMNPSFAGFLAGALRETVERVAPVDPRREARGVIGTSLGGLCAAYLAVEQGDVFGLFAAQSPALQASGGNFVPHLRRSPPEPVRFWIGTGTLRDTREEALVLRAELEQLGVPVRYVEAREGHSWGQWRAQLPDVLTYLFGSEGE